MIELRHVSATYPDTSSPALVDVDLEIAAGEFVLVVGPTGSGKTTFLSLLNGRFPHFTGGLLQGEVLINGRSTQKARPRDLADLVGVVGQVPAATFVADTVEDELVYAMENLGIARAVMRRRVEDALELLGLHSLRSRRLTTLSGGEQQRVAIGAVLTANPDVLVLDEPTSALDPAAAEDVLAALSRLVHDLGMTVVVSEHRLERALPFADHVIALDGAGRAHKNTPTLAMESVRAVPPVVELGRLCHWSPLPVSVREARRLAPALRATLASVEPPSTRETEEGGVVAHLDGVTVNYGPLRAVDSVTLGLRAGSVTALMGRNGAGKSSLLGLLAGVATPWRGTVSVLGKNPTELGPHDLVRTVGYVPQDAGVLLYASSIGAEVAAVDRDASLAPGTTAAIFDRLAPSLDHARHPRDLSEGQRLALALAIITAPRPQLVVLDEPTRGLDYVTKAQLAQVLRGLAREGHAVIVATHDVEFVAGVADRAIVLARGEVVNDGPAREVICHSPVFAPQVAKILNPLPWLTVDEVAVALEAS